MVPTTFRRVFNSQTSLGERLDLDWGARYTYAQTEIQKVQNPSTGDAFSIKDNWDNIVASGRLSYLVEDQGLYRIFGGVSQAFFAHQISRIFHVWTLTEATRSKPPGPNSRRIHDL